MNHVAIWFCILFAILVLGPGIAAWFLRIGQPCAALSPVIPFPARHSNLPLSSPKIDAA